MTTNDMTLNELYELLRKSQEEQTHKIMLEINKCSEEQDKKLKKTKEEVEQLQQSYISLERKRRENNIVVFGLTIENKDILQETLNILNNLLSINLQPSDINNIYSIGKNTNNRGLLIEFISYLTKKSIFKNISKLKNTKLRIADDLCSEDRERKRKLVRYLKLAKSKNQTARIIGFKLEMDGKKYNITELENLNAESDVNNYIDEETEGEGEEGAIVERTEENVDNNKKNSREIKGKSKAKNTKTKQGLNTRYAPRSVKI